jgi:hypothetical protein
MVSIILLLLVGSIGCAHAQIFIDHESSPEVNGSDLITLNPNMEYSPDEVVRFQVEALANNDKPYENAGIELVYRFASPKNKRITGPLYRFMRIVYNPFYRPILNHQIAHYGEVRVEGDLAFQIVLLTTEDGDRIGYIFTLSKQNGGHYDGCWMTDNVLLLLNFQET